MSQMIMAVWATSQRSTRSEIRTLPDGSALRLRARREIVPGTLGRFGSGASRPDSGVCGAASARAPGNIPRKDRLRMSLLALQPYHSIMVGALGNSRNPSAHEVDRRTNCIPYTIGHVRSSQPQTPFPQQYRSPHSHFGNGLTFVRRTSRINPASACVVP